MARANRSHSPHDRQSGSAYWIYGFHAVRSALANPRRVTTRCLATEAARLQLGNNVPGGFRIEVCHPERLTQILPPGSVHQGVALLCEPLPAIDLDEVLDAAAPGTRRVAV